MRLASGFLALVALTFGSAASAQTASRYTRVSIDGVVLEQAPANVRLVFHLIEADGARTDATGAQLPAAQGSDPSIEPVVAELRKIFRFQHYQLVSTSVLNVIPPSEASHSGGQQHLTDDRGRPYDLQVGLQPAGGDIRLSVQLSGMVTMDTPGGPVPSHKDLISASVNLQNGRSVVLGSTRLDGSPGALILVVTAMYDP